MTAPAQFLPEIGEPRDHSVTHDRPLTVDETADVLRCSRRTVAELVRHNRIPHIVAPMTRRVLIPPGWLAAWLAGEELELELTPDGGRIVRPVKREVTA